MSGYSFEHLLPENGRRFDRFLVGTEGTLGVVLDATVRLVEDAPFRALAVLGYPTMADAADAVPALLEHPLVACEGLDQRIAGMVQRRPELPDGGGWLFAEVTAATEEEAQSLAAAVARTAGVPHRIVTDIPEQLALWRIREDGAGLAARSLSRPAQAGWEDAAVPPAKLGAYLRDFDALLKESALDGVPYGHFGDGCVHVRIDFELEDTAGRGRYREFVESAADLVASYGGSMSGEHGDGRARSELLPRMYSPQAIALMQQAKRILDPDNLLNPGVLVEPAPFDSDLRLAAPQRPVRTTLRLTHDAGSFAGAVHRCTGVGKCIADNTGVGRGDVPVVRRVPRGEGLHPRPRPRAPGRRDGRPRLRRPGRRRRPRPVPVLQGLRAGLPDRHRHGDLQVGDPVPEVRRTAGLPAPPAVPLRARPAAALGEDDAAEAGQHDAAQQDARPGRQVRRRGRPAAQPSALLATPAALTRQAAGRERRRLDLGRLVHRPLRRGHRPGGGPAAGDQLACGRRSSRSPRAAA